MLYQELTGTLVSPKIPVVIAGDLELRIEKKNEILSGIRTLYGKEISSIISNFVNTKVLHAGRFELEEGEKLAIHQLSEFRGQFAGHCGKFCMSAPAIKAFLTDVFETLLECSQMAPQKPLVFRATTCPDYAYDTSTNKYLPQGELHCGPGLCGTITLEAFLPLGKLLTESNIPFILDFHFADIEGRDPQMRAKSNLTEDEFAFKVEASMQAMVELARTRLAETCILAEVRASKMSTDFEALKPAPNITVSPGKISGLVGRKRDFYNRFFHDISHDPLVRETFFAARSEKEIREHITLGYIASLARAHGQRITLMTLSIPALANFYNSTAKEYVPVIRFEREY